MANWDFRRGGYAPMAQKWGRVGADKAVKAKAAMDWIKDIPQTINVGFH